MLAVALVLSVTSPLRAPMQVGMSDGVGGDDLVWLAGLIVGAAGVLGALRVMLGPVLRMGREWAQMSEDWQGTPARPGFDRVPGVLERIQRIERLVEHLSDTNDKDDPR